MTDLIDRQVAVEEWKNDFKGFVNALNIPRDDYYGIMDYIDKLPFAERKKGHWISLDDFRGRYNEYGYKCSECGEHCYCEENYCSNCGARMESE